MDASRARLPLGRIVLVAGGLVVLVLLGRVAGAALPSFAAAVERSGVWGPIVFVLGYAAATVAFVPGSVLTLAAGAIFGLAKGTVYVLVAATLGSSIAFLVGRYLARGAVERRVRSNPRFAAIDRAVAAEGRRFVFLLRLSPVVPFNVLNYALGLTSVRFGDYLVASLGMIPGTLLYVYYGKLAGDLATVAGGAGVEKGAGYWAVLILGLVATVGATMLVTRASRRALRQVEDG